MIRHDTSKILFEDQFLKGPIQKEVTKLIFLLYLRNFRSLAKLIIPPLRTSHHVAFAVLVVQDFSTQRVAVAKIVLRRQSRDTRTYESRSRVIDDAFGAPLEKRNLKGLH